MNDETSNPEARGPFPLRRKKEAGGIPKEDNVSYDALCRDLTEQARVALLKWQPGSKLSLPIYLIHPMSKK